jgi:hypothetical protein
MSLLNENRKASQSAAVIESAMHANEGCKVVAGAEDKDF